MSDCDFGFFPFSSRRWRNMLLYKMIVYLSLLYRHLLVLRFYAE